MRNIVYSFPLSSYQRNWFLSWLIISMGRDLFCSIFLDFEKFLAKLGNIVAETFQETRGKDMLQKQILLLRSKTLFFISVQKKFLITGHTFSSFSFQIICFPV